MSEDEAMKEFTEVLNHVIAFRFSVNEEVEADLLLEADDGLYLLLDEFFVLLLGNLALIELGTGLTNFFCLLHTKS